jgi:N-acetylneuraminic acid mutarotase
MKIRTYTPTSSGVTNLTSNGGSVSGYLVLSRNPIEALEAATKNYVDIKFTNIDSSQITSGIFSPTLFPTFTGDITKASSSDFIELNNSTVSPGQYTKVTIDDRGIVTGGTTLSSSDIPDLDWSKITSDKPTSLAGYGITDGVSVNGAVMQGPLILPNDPTTDNELSTRQYVDNILTNSVIINVGDIIRKPKPDPVAGFLRCNGAVLDKTVYAALYAEVGDTFAVDIQPGSGKPWKQQYLINDLQDGDITGWATDTSLPGVAVNNSSIVTKNRVYVFGGSEGTTIYSTVYTAPINTDGTLGAWTTDTSLPGPLADSQAVVTNNRLYLLGGYNGSFVSTVYTAPINADGTLGTWATDTSLPGAMSRSQAVVTKNRIYLLGGYNGSFISTVYTAPINADGTLGTWTTGTSLPGPFSDSQAIVTNSRVYLLGGYNGSAYTGAVYTAPISGGLNDYSPYYDGTIVTGYPDLFMLPDTSSIDATEQKYHYIKY